MTTKIVTDIQEKSIIAQDFNPVASGTPLPGIPEDCRATPGETPRAGIRQGLAGIGGCYIASAISCSSDGWSLPVPAKNSFPPPTSFPPHYLDVGDNVYANVRTYPRLNSDTLLKVFKDSRTEHEDDNIPDGSDWLNTNCGDSNNQWFIPGTCENGHRYAKVIACGKEWCPVCGKMGSIAHNRRYVRWLPKVMQFKCMSYITLPLPEDIRPRTKEELRHIQRCAVKVMKRHGYKRGLFRWHWYGDKSHKWHPHPNILVDGGYIQRDKLDSIKRDWAKELGVDIVVIHNKYKRTPGDMASCLHYVTRATFLDWSWDVDMAMELKGFRNMVVWGKGLWSDEPVWDIDKVERNDDITGEPIKVEDIESIVEHTCPRCHAVIHWDSALPGQLLDIADKESLGAGYYSMVDRSPPGNLSDRRIKRLNYMRLIDHAKTMASIMESDN